MIREAHACLRTLLTLLWVIFLISAPLAQAQDQPESDTGLDTKTSEAAAGDAASQAQEAPEATQPATAPAVDEIRPLDDEDVDLLDLDVPVVVTVTRRAQNVATMPYAINVITAEDIRRSGARTVPDALRQAVGIDIADLAYGASAVSPRGFYGFLSNQVLVLVDGRQIYDSMFGGALWGSWPFQLEDIERIEVIRGSAGLTWGANAVNGGINVITKDPSDQLGLTYTGGGGSRGTYKTHLGYAFKEQDLRLRISGEYEASDGFKKGGSWLLDLDDRYRAGRMNIHAIYEKGADQLMISGGNSLVDGCYSAMPTAGFGFDHNSGSQASFLLGKWTHKVDEDNSYDFTGYVNDFQMSPGIKQVDYRYQQFALQYGHNLKVNDQHTFTWGVDFRADLLDGSNSDPFIFTKDHIDSATIGAYFQDEWRFAPKWTFNIGGRIDYESYCGFEPSARASLSYQIDDNLFTYIAASRAFHAVSNGMRFMNLPMANGLIYTTGEHGLSAEHLISYEWGIRGRFFNRLTSRLNFFWADYTDLVALQMKAGPPGLVRMHADNIAWASVYGVELSNTLDVTKDLKILGNYTFQRYDWKGGSSALDSDLVTMPEHKFMVGTRYSVTENLHLAEHLYFVDDALSPNPANPFKPRQIDEYFRLDLNAEYEFWEDRAVLAVGVRNLLDDNHYEGSTQFLNDTQVPRMIYAELRIHFE